MVNVTAAIIERDGKVLLAKRSSKGSLPNKWEFPGGKVDDGETPEACLSRELWEEFEIEVAVGAFVAESIYNYDHGSVRLMAYQVYTDADIITMNAHDDIEWVTKGHLLDYDLAPADVPIAKRMI